MDIPSPRWDSGPGKSVENSGGGGGSGCWPQASAWLPGVAHPLAAPMPLPHPLTVGGMAAPWSDGVAGSSGGGGSRGRRPREPPGGGGGGQSGCPEGPAAECCGVCCARWGGREGDLWLGWVATGAGPAGEGAAAASDALHQHQSTQLDQVSFLSTTVAGGRSISREVGCTCYSDPGHATTHRYVTDGSVAISLTYQRIRVVQGSCSYSVHEWARERPRAPTSPSPGCSGGMGAPEGWGSGCLPEALPVLKRPVLRAGGCDRGGPRPRGGPPLPDHMNPVDDDPTQSHRRPLTGQVTEVVRLG